MISEEIAESVLARYRMIRQIDEFISTFPDRLNIKVESRYLQGPGELTKTATVNGARLRNFLRAEVEILRAEIKSLSEEPE